MKQKPSLNDYIDIYEKWWVSRFEAPASRFNRVKSFLDGFLSVFCIFPSRDIDSNLFPKDLSHLSSFQKDAVCFGFDVRRAREKALKELVDDRSIAHTNKTFDEFHAYIEKLFDIEKKVDEHGFQKSRE